MSYITKALEFLFGSDTGQIVGSLHQGNLCFPFPESSPNRSNDLVAGSTMSCEEDFSAEQLARVARADMQQSEVVCSWLLRHPCDTAAAVCAQDCHPSYLLDVIRSSRALSAEDPPTPHLVAHWRSFRIAGGLPTSRLAAYWESAHS